MPAAIGFYGFYDASGGDEARGCKLARMAKYALH